MVGIVSEGRWMNMDGFELADCSFAVARQESGDGRRLFDAHCHVSFAGNGRDVARGLQTAGVRCFSNTVTPREYVQAKAFMKGFPNVTVGLGLHPWWLLDGRCDESDILLFEDLAVGQRFVGEIGLDFGRKFKEALSGCRARMVDAFERAVAACMQGSERRVISIHSVRSAGMVLDVLERTGCVQEHDCILHWFSGTSDELQRAIKLGCWFSVGRSMLLQKKGREYAKAIPADRLLLETDEPSEKVDFFGAEFQISSLTEAYEILLGLKNGRM